MIARAKAKTGPRRSRLLYIGDHAESIALVEKLLAGRKDLLLLHAADANLGIERSSAERPDVILIDIDMPGPGDAVALMKLLRANPALHATPILALSASFLPAAIVKGLEAGFFQCLTKPLQAGAFMEGLDFALEFIAVERSEDNPHWRKRKEVRDAQTHPHPV